MRWHLKIGSESKLGWARGHKYAPQKAPSCFIANMGHEVHRSLSSWQSPKHRCRSSRNHFRWPASVGLAFTSEAPIILSKRICRLVPEPGGQKIKRAGRIKVATCWRLISALHPQGVLQNNGFGLSHHSAFPTGMAMVYSTVLRGCIRRFGVSMHYKR